MTLVAKFTGTNPTSDRDHEGRKLNEHVRLYPVYSTDPSNPNTAWAKATPAGFIELLIDNPDAFGQIVAGREYLVRIEEAAAE